MLLAAAGSAGAMVVETMRVEREDTRFIVHARIQLDVAPAVAFRAATDYERLPQFNPSVIVSKRLSEKNSSSGRLRSDVRLCVALFCKTVRQVMRYKEYQPDAIDMHVVPGAGDLKSGHVQWRFDELDSLQTRLSLDATIEPAFWVPPLIGGYLVARELKRQARVTGQAIERLAADYATPDARQAADSTTGP